MSVEAINWNAIVEDVDNDVWKTMTNNYWLPEKIAVSNDLPSYSTLTASEKWVLARVFGGLTMLDTLQSEKGAVSLLTDARTPHERANLTFISAMESVHARSYSNIFSTFCSTNEIDEIFRWVAENPQIKTKSEIISAHYDGKDPIMRKAASVFLESFLFYSGFYVAFYWASRAKLTNTADMIRLILRDEAVHGYYIGAKMQMALGDLPEKKQKDYRNRIYALMQDLYENELRYTEELYDRMGSGVAEDVKRFIRYNANKALANMGMEPAFEERVCEVSAAIMAQLNPVSEETHDFFSGSGSSYILGEVEQTTDEDWANPY